MFFVVLINVLIILVLTRLCVLYVGAYILSMLPEIRWRSKCPVAVLASVLAGLFLAGPVGILDFLGDFAP